MYIFDEMRFPDFLNYLFIPGSESGRPGTLYELEESAGFAPNSFVLVPYSNPQVKKPEPRFFKIKNKVDYTPTTSLTKNDPAFQIRTKTTREDYLNKVRQLKEHIQQGNIYEINFCIQFFAENASIEPLLVFQKLHAISKAPYAQLLRIGSEYIISSSPELFLRKEGKHLASKPIKGTTRRGANPEEDARLKDELYHSIKERTENVMAVDVARNDLSMLATKGSVEVNKLYNIESFETVHQMVSTVHCDIKENVEFDEILNATFPMASMTGAPKKRAMQLIDEFEGFERGPYSGAMGLIDKNGDFELSVIIRSIFYNEEKHSLSLSVGSAITYLSNPEEEYKECLLKAKALFSALEASDSTDLKIF